MTVGFTDTRKNLELLVRAYRELPDDLRTSLQIVFAGDLGPVYAERLRAEAADLGLDEDTIVIPGRIPEPQLRALYQSAALFVFPSLAEGFGLPVVEAIACGCPAILADSSALPEILEWPPALFDPADATSLAALIERALRDTAFRAELEAVCRAAMPRHTWDAVARRTIGALERVDQRGGHGHYTPARIALAGTVDAGLVRALRERIQVDRFVPGGRTAVESARRAEGSGPVFLLGALGTSVSATQYDAVLHVVADGPDREAQHAATVRVPGPVVSATDLRRIDADRLLAGVVAPAPVVPRVLGS
jgi:hypothetical protein